MTIRLFLAREPPASADFLGPWERSHAASMRIAKRREEFVLGRWAARQLVGADVEIIAAADGAPEAFRDGARLPVAISISHRAGVALAAVDDSGAPLGADLELIEPRSAAFISDYFTPHEAAAATTPLYANLIWSAKESALKALRQGLRADTRSVEVRLKPEAPGIWQEFHVGGACESRGWWRREGDHVITVVGASPPELKAPR